MTTVLTTMTLGEIRRSIREAVSPRVIDGRDAPPNDNDVDLSLGDTAAERAANELVGLLPPGWEADVVDARDGGSDLTIDVGVDELRDELDPNIVDAWNRAKRVSARHQRSFEARRDAARDSGKRAQIRAASERPGRVKDSSTAVTAAWIEVQAAVTDVIHDIMVDELGYAATSSHGLPNAFFTRGKIAVTFWPASYYVSVTENVRVTIRAVFVV